MAAMVPIIVLVMSSLISFIGATGISSSLAIIPLADNGGTLVCAIVLRNTARRIECSDMSVEAGEPFPILSNISFALVSGSDNSLCGLQDDNTALFCSRHIRGSNYTNVVSRLIYENVTAPLREIVVGDKNNIAATDKSGAFIRLWDHSGNSPTKLPGNFSSLTSGNDFICAIDNNYAVDCWGPHGANIKVAFASEKMAVIVADNFRVCGVTTKGKLLCNVNDLEQPTFEFRSLALGWNDTCVLRPNGTAVCWGAKGKYYPTEDLSFLFLIAKDNLFCGLTTHGHIVHCWWTKESPSRSVQLPLQKVAPGICASRTSCDCSFLGGSSQYCSNNLVICVPCLYPSHRSLWSQERIEWLVLGCVAFAGILLGIWSQWNLITSYFSGACSLQ